MGFNSAFKGLNDTDYGKSDSYIAQNTSVEHLTNITRKIHLKKWMPRPSEYLLETEA
jgi:hypothetical protein